jgi:hypothetical protein
MKAGGNDRAQIREKRLNVFSQRSLGVNEREIQPAAHHFEHREHRDSEILSLRSRDRLLGLREIAARRERETDDAEVTHPLDAFPTTVRL